MVMKCVLLGQVLVLLWVSVAWAEVLVQPDFDAKKFSGLWYVASMVSDCKVFLGKKDHLLMSTRAIKAMAGGNLSVHMEFPRADGCHQVDAEYLRVGSEGHFRVPGRTQEASPQAVKIFRDFYPTVGLPDDMMVMLPKSDMCSSGDKEAP
ncbi:lipocalin-15 isoform X6 [Halichoerus grypus]